MVFYVGVHSAVHSFHHRPLFLVKSDGFIFKLNKSDANGRVDLYGSPNVNSQFSLLNYYLLQSMHGAHILDSA